MTKNHDEDSHPWAATDLQLAPVMAIKALNDGVANEGQQKMALDYIIMVVAKTYDCSYRPGGQDGERDTSFAEGKRYVGNTIVKIIKMSTDSLRRRNDSILVDTKKARRK